MLTPSSHPSSSSAHGLHLSHHAGARLARLQRLRGTFVAVAEDTVLSVYRPCKVRRRKLLAEGA